MKRILSLLLAFTLLMSCVPANVFGTEQDHNTQEEMVSTEQEVTTPATEPVETTEPSTPMETTDPAATEPETVSPVRPGKKSVSLPSRQLDDAEDITPYLTYKIENGQVTITDCDTSVSGDFYIPDTIEGCPVTAINNLAFYLCKKLTGIVIPDSVQTISRGVFDSCSSLQHITVPFVGESRKTTEDRYQYPFGYIFGTSSFSGSTSVSQKYYDYSSDKNTTYYLPTSLKSVTVTGGEILPGAFYGCNTLTSVTLPENITAIGKNAFYSCYRLESIFLPDGLTTLGDYAFYNCYALTEVDIPFGVTTVGAYAFASCSGLTRVGVAESVTALGSSAFSACKSLTEIFIPASVKTIGTYALYNCTSLQTVTFGGNGPTIGSNVFLYSTPTAYYYASASGWTASKLQNYGGTVTWKALSAAPEHTHVTVILPAVEPNCESGLSQGEKCRLCGNVIVEQQVLPGLGHNEVIDPAVEPTATQPGRTQGSHCDRCGKVLAESQELPVLGSEHIGDLTYTVENDTVTITGYTGTATILQLPGVIDGKPVTKIAAKAFSGKNLTALSIPESVTEIASGALYGCGKLQSLTVPFVGGSRKTETETYQYPLGYIFGTSSYTGGTSTTQYYYGSSVSYTTSGRYYIPTTLTTVTVTGGSLNYGAFYNCSKLTALYLGSGVTGVAEKALYGCSSLTYNTWENGKYLGNAQNPYLALVDTVSTSMSTFQFHEDVELIASYSFEYCYYLTELRIPDGVRSIGYGAFYSCYKLTAMTIPFVGGSRKTAEELWQYPFGYIFGDDSFTGTTITKQYFYQDDLDYEDYTYYYIPTALKSVTVTGGELLFGAFYDCDLTEIIIGDGVEVIREGALSCCGKLQSLTIPFVGERVKTAEELWQYPLGYIFGTDSYTEGVSTYQVYRGSSTSSNTYSYYYIPKTLKNVTVTGGELLSGSFYGCSNLTAVTVGDGVAAIAEGAFHGCGGLTQITLPFLGGSRKAITETYQYPLGYIFGTDSFSGASRVTQYYYGYTTSYTTLEYYYIPNKLTTVTVTGGEVVAGAFSGCESITSVTLPENATYIGHEAFRECSGLTSVAIPSGVTYIGSWAFYDCPKLTQVTIPAGVTQLATDAFQSCQGLKGIWVDAGNSVYCSDAKGVLYNKAMTYLIQAPAMLTGSYTIPNSVQILGENAFQYCGISAVTIPEHITKISDWCFYGCHKLTGVAIPEGVTEIGEYAFGFCEALTEISVPAGVGSIEECAFISCYGLTGIWVAPANAAYCSDAQGVLYNKAKTELIEAPGALSGSYTIPETVNNVKVQAFHSCKNLTEVTVPASVTQIERNAFEFCYALTKITFLGDCPQINDFSFYYTTATAYYPAHNATWTEAVRQNYGGTLTWVGDGHTEETVAALAPTCTQTGLTEGIRCSECGETIVAQQVIPALGHQAVTSPAVAPTCTEAGLTEGKHCRNCNEVLAVQETVEALGHNQVTDAAVAPTCTEAGLTEGSHCDRCGEILTAQEAISALGHVEIPDIGYAPTCIDDGLSDGIHCDRCGEILAEQKVLPALGHTMVTEPAVAATCLETGLTIGKYCSACGERFISQKVTPALGHDYVAEVTPPTATAQGYTTHTCSRCQDSYIDSFTNETADETWETDLINLPKVKSGGTGSYAYNTEKLGSNSSKRSLRLDGRVTLDLLPDSPMAMGNGTLQFRLLAEGGATLTFTFFTGGVKTGEYAVNTADTGWHDAAVQTGSISQVDTVRITVSGSLYLDEMHFVANGDPDATVPTAPSDTEPTVPGSTEPSGTAPTVPGSTEPSGTAPTVPGSTEPTVPGATDPTQPGVTEPSATEPEATEPEHTHTYGPWQQQSAASCTAEGVLTRGCGICGHIATRTVPVLPHSYDAVITPPTATAQGYTTYTCTVCGESYIGSYTNALAVETPEEDLINLPKFQSDGQGSYAYSTDTVKDEKSVRSLALTGNVTVDLLPDAPMDLSGKHFGFWLLLPEGMDPEEAELSFTFCGSHGKTAAYIPTCTPDASGWYRACLSTALIREDLSWVDTVRICWAEAETCYIDYLLLYDNETGEVVKPEQPDTDVPDATEPIEPSEPTAPGATEPSGTAPTVPDATEPSATEPEATEPVDPEVHIHEFGPWQEVQPATCTEEGELERTCVTCGEKQTRTVPALGHLPETVPGREPTCLEPGYTESVVCSRCNEILEPARAIEPLGHSFTEWIVRKEPTYNEPGEKYRYCTRCGYEETEGIPPIALDENHGLAHFTVVNAQTLEPIAGAHIAISTETEGSWTLTTDTEGRASTVMPVGRHPVTAYANGYRTRNLNIKIVSGENDLPAIGLSALPTYEVTFDQHPMTYEEIVEAGIDVDSDDNRHFYRQTLRLDFTPEYAEQTHEWERIEINYVRDDTDHTYNGNGYVSYPGDPVSYEIRWVPWHIIGSGDGPSGGSTPGNPYGGGGGYFEVPRPGKAAPIKIYPVSEHYYLIIYSEVSWLKEMFDVEMLIVNNSYTDTLENLDATLYLPQGLSLATMVGQQQTLVQHIDKIEEAGSRSIHWYVRGDTAGSYSLEARLTGQIMPFEEPIDDRFICKNQLQVWAGNALNLHYSFPETAYYGMDYPITITLTNVSDISLYDLKYIFAIQQGMDVQYHDGTTVHRVEWSEWEEVGIPEFKPGDKLVVQASVNIFFKNEWLRDYLLRYGNESTYKRQLVAGLDALGVLAQAAADTAETLAQYEEGLTQAIADANAEAMRLELIALRDSVRAFRDACNGNGTATYYTYCVLQTADISQRLEQLLQDPQSWYENTGLTDRKQLVSVMEIYAEEAGTKVGTAGKAINTIRGAVFAVPMRFILQSVTVNEDPSNTTDIPWSYTVLDEVTAYSGITVMSRRLRDTVAEIIGTDVVDNSQHCQYYMIAGLEPDMEGGSVTATENETTSFLVKDSTDMMSYRAWVVSNTRSGGSDLILSSDAEDASWENGVLTFTGSAMVDVTPCGQTGGVLCIEDSSGNLSRYVIDVVAAHTCQTGTPEVLVAPVGENPGVSVAYCSVCGDLMDIQLTEDCQSHSYTDWQVLSTADCVTPALRSRSCTLCGAVENEQYAAALGHDEITDAAVAETCTETGLTEGKHCGRCGLILVAQETVPALGHIEVIDEAVAPTCTETGLTEGKHCSRCSEILIAQNVIPALGHIEVIDEAAAPTCTETGLTEGKHCSRCEAILIAQQVIPALGHDAVIDAAVVPTCLETGLTEGKHCRRCEEILVEQQVVPALGHDEITDAAVAPSCTETGLTEGKHCGRCSEILIAQNAIPALGHIEVIDEAAAPTCTETGLTEGKHCSRCEAILIAQQVIPALGHIEIIDPAVAATCLESGLTEGKHCQRCGEILVAQQVVPALGHDEITDAAVAPSCTETGLTEGKHCGRCGLVLVAQESIPALGHIEVIDPAVAPTCLETGLTEGTHCSRCGLVLVAQETVPALGHIEVMDEAVDPTCTETGLTEGKHCSRCGLVLVAQETIPALGHIEVMDEAVDPTCTETGLTEGQHCSRCDAVLVAQEIIPALGHEIVIDPAVEATQMTTGLTQGEHCSRCGAVLVAQQIIPVLGSEHIPYLIYEINDQGGITVTGYTGNAQKLILPGVIEDRIVTQIADKAFYGGYSLVDVVLAPCVETIGERAFYNCYSLRSFTFGDRVVSIGGWAFAYCRKLERLDIPNSTETIGQFAFYICEDMHTVTLGNRVKTIGERAFEFCSGLTEIFIPASVTSLGQRMFNSCASLTGIWVSEDNIYYSSDSRGVLLDKSKFKLIQAPGGISGHYEIPEGVLNVGIYAFHNCTKLTNLIVSERVGNIGECAFYGCSGLESVTFEGNAPYIHRYAFNRVTTTAYYPGNNTTWTSGKKSNYGGTLTWQVSCGHETVIVVPAVEPDCISYGWTEGAQCGLCGLVLVAQEQIPKLGHDIVILPGKEPTENTSGLSEGKYCARCGWTLEEQQLLPPIGLEGLEIELTWENEIAVLGYTGTATELVLPETIDGYPVTQIASQAFENCETLKKITLPETLLSIDEYAFSVSGLTEIVIPSQIVEIGTGAFSGCRALTSVTFPEGLTDIWYDAFLSCEALETVTFPESLQNIHESAFVGCTSLKSVTFPAAVQSIRADSFTFCEALTEIRFMGDAPEISEDAFREVFAAAYYPEDNATWTEDKLCSYGGCLTWVAFHIHTEVVDPAVSPTCEMFGLTEGKHCGTCGEILVAQEFILPSGHDWITDSTGTRCGICGMPGMNVGGGGQHPEIVITAITKQPEAVSADSGETVQFRIETSGEVVSYKWEYRKIYKWFNTSMEGYNTDTLTVAATGARNGYDYRCVVTFADGTVLESEPAELTVKTYMNITYHPNDQVVVLGYKGQFTAAAEGEGIKYQWQYCRPGSEKWIDTAMEGATKPTVMIETTTARNGYKYRCRITDVTGNEQFTNPATMSVLSFKSHPQEAFASNGATVQLTVSTSVSEGFSYQWQYRRSAIANWSNTTMEGYNTATLSVAATLARNGYEYRCVLTGAKNSQLASKSAVLHVGNSVVFTTQPQDATCTVGDTAVFTVVATNAYSYQWQYQRPGSTAWNNTTMEGCNTAALSVGVTTARDGYKYRCVVTGLDGIEYYTKAATLNLG